MSTTFINKNGKKVERTKCEIYTRVMGYHRPVTSFNIGKKSEFYSRNYFKENNENKEFTKEFDC
ncbi:hypothetical protein CSB08_00510 [Candidatus Gracilibacteria bacterium]|nr:MAG: hypothetical protein CSB08_00510 [Candidatus Gracilibacteria bacterium]PIE85321.1 MAG: hypothetical protein CSA08_02860 [Candidatus Gracilibacteria bacterium]